MFTNNQACPATTQKSVALHFYKYIPARFREWERFIFIRWIWRDDPLRRLEPPPRARIVSVESRTIHDYGISERKRFLVKKGREIEIAICWCSWVRNNNSFAFRNDSFIAKGDTMPCGISEFARNFGHEWLKGDGDRSLSTWHDMLQAVGVLRTQFEECFFLLRNGDRRDDATELFIVCSQ